MVQETLNHPHELWMLSQKFGVGVGVGKDVFGTALSLPLSCVSQSSTSSAVGIMND